MREVIHLNYNWYFSKFKVEHLNDYHNNEGFQLVNLPHNDINLPFNYLDVGYNELVSTYKKEIMIKEEYRGKLIKLVFEGIAHETKVFLNNKFITSHQGGYDEFTVDITSNVNFGETNYLMIIVDNHENPNIPPFGHLVDYLGYGGIYREVQMVVLDKNHVEACYLKMIDNESKTLSCNVITSNVEGDIQVIIKDQNIVYNNHFQVNGLNNKFLCELDNIILWDLDTPHLYNVYLKYYYNGVLCDEISYRFGFRKVEFTKNGFYLNNKKVKLRGLNRHQSYPYVGYAMPKRVQAKDADILKYDLGLNIVRTSHYMQSKHFLNRCDEIGLLVFEEIPGWQHIGEKKFQKNTLVNVEQMIKRDYNHPSIIMWGVRINESPDDDWLYQRTNQLAHQLDDSRPTGGVRNFMNSKMFEDVYTFNDFVHSGDNKGLQNPDKVKRGVPYLVSEYNGHMFPTKRYDNEKHLVEHALRHYRVLNEACRYDRISGTIGWSMNDYNTHPEFGSGDHVCYHGVLDMYRLPKYAAYVYSSQQDDKPVLEVLSTINPGDYPAGLIKKVYVATNLDYLKLYKNDVYIKTYYPSKNSLLKHPLVIIDDFIGNQLEEKEGFSKKDAYRAKKVFQAVSEYGYNLPFKYKLMMFMIMKKNKLTLDDATNLYYKYGVGRPCYRLEGYKNNQLVKTIKKENVTSSSYQMEIDNLFLEHGITYDATRVVIKKVDQNNNLLRYAFDGIKIEVTKGLELIGPNVLSLIGGAIAFWVKTNGQANDGEIVVQVAEQEIKNTIKIKVKQ